MDTTTGELIKLIRLEKKLTQKELAEKLNISQQLIAQYEKGTKIPKLETIKKIAVALDVPYGKLLNAEDYKLINFFGENVHQAIKDIEQALIKDDKTEKMTQLMDQLNDAGQDKALDQVELLTKIEEFKK